MKSLKAFIRNTIRESFWRYAVVCDGNIHYAFTFAQALQWAQCYKVQVFGAVKIYNDKHRLVAAVLVK
jgi:hypothetical protein